MKSNLKILSILKVYLVTGATLAIYSLIQRQIVDFDRIFLFWVQLTPIIIIFYLIKWTYYRFAKKSEKLSPFKTRINFKKNIVLYVLISLILGLLPFFFLLSVVAKEYGYSNPILWTIDAIKEGVVYKQKYANISPPPYLQIGGMGPKASFLFSKYLDSIPKGFYFERTDSRGYNIYIPRGNAYIQINRPEQYTDVVVENKDKWISLYILEN